MVAGRIRELPAALLAGTGLAATSYATVGAPDTSQARAAFASATVQHRRAREDVRRLLDAWAGARVLAFKGFHLAEWVYRTPAARPYGDVDLLVDPGSVPFLARAAERAGWRVAWSRLAGPLRFEHAALQLVAPGGHTHVDVHRYAAPCGSPFDAVQRRVTRAVWDASEAAVLDGAPLRVPSPQDAALVGLALNRFWSTDALTPKPHDYLDLVALRDRHGLTPAGLEARARDLGCRGTWRLYLRHCDPWAGRLRLDRPGLLARHAYLARIALERPHPYVEDLLMRGLRFGLARVPEGAPA